MMNSEDKDVLLKFILVFFGEVLVNFMLECLLIDLSDGRVPFESKLSALHLVLRKHKITMV
jgi:hypothetical protein